MVVWVSVHISIKPQKFFEQPCRLRRIRPKEEALTRGGLPHIFAMYGQKSAEAIVAGGGVSKEY
jgi:hypothetical protein